MEDVIRDLLDGEIERRSMELETMDASTNEYERQARNVIELHKIRLEYERLDNDRKMRQQEQDMEYELREADLRQKKDDQFWTRILGYIKSGSELTMFLLMLRYQSSWLRKGFEFEENGSLSSRVFQTVWSNNRLIDLFRKK